jgi:hypothetical protein
MKGFGVAAAIAALIGISMLIMLAALNRRDQTVGLNQEIFYDDFAFSVLGVRKAESLGTGDDESIPKGVYYIVTLKVANNAKRVDYKPGRASAVLIDNRRREFPVSAAGQAALRSVGGPRCPESIPAGASCVTEVVFDVPRDAQVSQLRVSGGLVGDILDVVFYGKKRIDLESLQ